MTAQPANFSSFIDAARDSVAREIAALRRDAQREREVRDAEHRARLAELDARISSVADVERRLAERVASLKDGEKGDPGDPGAPGKSITVEEVAPLIEVEVSRRVSEIPIPKDGEDGKSITIEDVEPVIAELLSDVFSQVEEARTREYQGIEDRIVAEVERAVAAIPIPKDGKDGKDADEGAIKALVSEYVMLAVDAIPRPQDGKSVTVEDVAPLITEQVEEAVAAIPVPRDGKDIEPEEVAALVAEEVERAVGALPRPQDGKSVTLDDVAPLIDEAVSRAVSELPAPKDGEDGAPGKLPIVRCWTDGVHYEADVVTHEGATYQALRDTGKEPPGDDWICIARAGRDGEDGRSFRICGTWGASHEYQALDIVALNGAAFAARRDDPGVCPGEGWQLIASRGKQGKPGEKGSPGVGLRGNPGPTVKSMQVSDDGVLTLTNADGTTVECDLYPLLSKLQVQRV